MRIAFVAHYAHLYGANRSLLALLQGMRAHGVVPLVVVPGTGELTQELQRCGIDTAIVPIRWWVSTRRSVAHSAWRLYNNALLLRPLVSRLREWRADVIYTNSGVTPIGAMLAACMSKPHIWHLREFIDLDYALKHDWGKTVFRRVVARADARIAVSHALRKHLLDTNLPNTHVIYNGVASARQFESLYDEANARSRNRARFTFALVGLVQPAKGQELAIRAFSEVARRHSDAQLLIVGGGDPVYVDHCKMLAHALGVGQNVVFWGYVTDPFRAYIAADAVLMCSDHEAMGRVTAEAMASCRPVIGRNTAGTAEIVDHEKNGLLYGDEQDLTECMLRLIEEPGLARVLGENAWREASQKYTVEHFAMQVFNVVRTALG